MVNMTTSLLFFFTFAIYHELFLRFLIYSKQFSHISNKQVF